MPQPNTALKQAERDSTKEVQDGERFRKDTLHKFYTNEPKVEVCMSPMYQPYFGTVMDLTINGISIYLPVDGRTYKLPESFASMANERRIKIDEARTRADRMADVTRNHEKYIGDLKLV